MEKQNYLALVNKAQHASFAYYVESVPSMSDAEFDELVGQIEKIEAEHPEWIVPDSPTQCIGSDLSANGRRTVRHRTPMLSCQKAQDTESVLKWLKKAVKTIGHDKFSVTLEWKYDGISCSLVYQDGCLVSASTRGDGAEGQDILDHVAYILDIPQKLKGDYATGRIEIRGEIICPTTNLHKMSARYSDCRTAASSLCNQSEPSSDCALLSFRPWSVDVPHFHLNDFNFETLELAYWQLGCGVSRQASVFDANYPEGIIEEIAAFEAHRQSLEFPTDGIVIKINDKQLFQSLGSTAHHPKGSIAYKFPPTIVRTKCTSVGMTIGKSGRRTPVAYFEPVTILGRTVSCASLYSESCAEKLGIKPGSTIEVGLSNDVIPKVYRVVE